MYQNGTGTGSSPNTPVFPCHHHPTNAPFSSTTDATYFSNSQRRYTTNNYSMMDIAHWIYSAVTNTKLQHKNRIYLTLQKTDRLKQN